MTVMVKANFFKEVCTTFLEVTFDSVRFVFYPVIIIIYWSLLTKNEDASVNEYD